MITSDRYAILWFDATGSSQPSVRGQQCLAYRPDEGDLQRGHQP